MGSSSSKSREVTSAESPRRSVSRNVFQNNCIINRSSTDGISDIDDVTDDEQITDNRVKETVIEQNRSNMSTSKSKGNKTKRADKRACRHSETQISEWGESSLSGSVSRSGSGSSRNRSSRFLSRFSFFPGNTSSRSSRSSRAYPESSTSSVISNDDIQSSRSANKSKTRQGCDIFPSCLMPMSPEHRDDDSDSDNSDASSIRELGRYDNNNEIESNRNRRMEAREPVEQNVRFSRTLSVGRLRDRVLQRPSFPELASFPFQQEQEVSSGSDNRETESRSSNENVATPVTSSNYSMSAMTNSFYGNHEFEVENLGSRDSSSYANLLEHRSNFLERRRRIRSQVHALQRMGSRFENLSGHERSCILSGQHRTGHCTCRLSNQDAIDGANARGSISRIVLLAEALFEVLDEIHQQSVVSSSRPALSSIGSVPAPVEVVEALPVKLHHKLPKKSYEDDAQCYICLVEYEDGDEVRVLPCHHEFHRLCVDKWLKEIHRICPLCRGDVCKISTLPTESSQL